MTLMPLSALCQTNSQPLNADEKRQILLQLIELKSCRSEIPAYVQAVAALEELQKKEKANSDRALELEKQATALAQKERDLALERAKFYEQMYQSVTKRRTIGCTIKLIFTLGMARCR